MSPTVVLTWASARRSVRCSWVTCPVLPDGAPSGLRGTPGSTEAPDDRGDHGDHVDLAGQRLRDRERAADVGRGRQIPVADRCDRHEAEVEEVLGGRGSLKMQKEPV